MELLRRIFQQTKRGEHCFFWHLFHATPEKFSDFYATLFYSTSKIFMPSLSMPTPNFEMFIPQFFMPPWLFMCSRKIRNSAIYIDIFNTLSFWLPILLCHLFLMPPSKKLKSLCHPQNLFHPAKKTMRKLKIKKLWRGEKKNRPIPINFLYVLVK